MNKKLENLSVGYFVPSATFRAIDEHIAVMDTEMNLIALTGPSDRDEATTGAKEHAQLFAAAPDLLDALELCYSELNQLAFMSGDKLAKIALDKARAAIDKAKGLK